MMYFEITYIESFLYEIVAKFAASPNVHPTGTDFILGFKNLGGFGLASSLQ